MLLFASPLDRIDREAQTVSSAQGKRGPGSRVGGGDGSDRGFSPRRWMMQGRTHDSWHSSSSSPLPQGRRACGRVGRGVCPPWPKARDGRPVIGIGPIRIYGVKSAACLPCLRVLRASSSRAASPGSTSFTLPFLLHPHTRTYIHAQVQPASRSIDRPTPERKGRPTSKKETMQSLKEACFCGACCTWGRSCLGLGMLMLWRGRDGDGVQMGI